MVRLVELFSTRGPGQFSYSLRDVDVADEKSIRIIKLVRVNLSEKNICPLQKCHVCMVIQNERNFSLKLITNTI